MVATGTDTRALTVAPAGGQDEGVVSMAVESDVAAPLGLVFDYVTDWTNAPRFVVGLKSWVPLDDGPPGAGSRFSVEIGAALGSLSGDLEITRFEPGVAIEWKGLSGPEQTGGWIFSPLPPDGGRERCHVRFQLAYTPRLTGLVGKAMNKPVEVAVKTTLQQSANRLKDQCEALAGSA